MVLWEGNIGVGMTADNIHGTANGYTLFRNYLLGRDTGAQTKTMMTNSIYVHAFNRFFNFVGNVVGTAGYHTHYEHLPTSSIDPGDAAYSNLSIYSVGWSANMGTYWSGPPAIPNDSLTATGMMRWGNYDTVTNAVRWDASEVPSGLSQYANSVPPDHNLPPSIYLSSKPDWWPATIPWPPIGPDVTGGNVSGLGGHVYKIPARVCYDNTAKDANGILLFNANTCHGSGGTGSAPASPKNLRIR
jgi:hypothetical protein